MRCWNGGLGAFAFQQVQGGGGDFAAVVLLEKGFEGEQLACWNAVFQEGTELVEDEAIAGARCVGWAAQGERRDEWGELTEWRQLLRRQQCDRRDGTLGDIRKL